MSAGANPDIVTGTWVDVHYKTQLGNYQWWERRFTAKFLYQTGDGKTVFFDGRPVYGTTDLELKNIISMKPSKHRKATYGVNVRRLPKQD